MKKSFDMADSSTSSPAAGNWPWPLVALAGWLLPGLGHVLLGERRRGAIAGATLIALFIAGLLLGGIDVVDRRNDTLWFAGQVLIGPIAIAADLTHQALDDRREAQVSQYAEEHRLGYHEALERMMAHGPAPAYTTSVSWINDVGTLYCAIAGVMNLLAILDAVGRATAGRISPRVQESKTSRVAGDTQ